jgi:hypothetical protein
MAITSTGYQSPATSREGLKPSVLDEVVLLGAYDTPLLSKIGRSTVTNYTHSWITDPIGDPVKNAKLEITDFTGATKATKQKTSNQVQILTEEVMISKSMQRIATYGCSEMAHEVAKKGKKHALDIEFMLLGLGRDADELTSLLKAPVTRADATPGESAGIFYFLTKGVNSFTSGARGNILAFDADGDGTGAVSDFTEDKMNQVLQLIWDNGETPKDIFVGANLKKAFNALVTRQLGNEAFTNRRVTSLETDFGTVNVHLHRFFNTTNGLANTFLAGNFDYSRLGTLWSTTLEDVTTSKTATAKRYYTEATLEVKNANAFAAGIGLEPA